MSERPIGERMTAVEVSLQDHLKACEKKHDKNFRLLLVLLAAILSVAAKQFGLI